MANLTSACWLLGNPVNHSLSPTIHNAAFNHLGLPFLYETNAISTDEVESTIAKIDGQNVVGANVTIPHKQTVLPFLDELTPVASRVAAVNTIFVRDGKRIGHNTDVEGFLAPLDIARHQKENVLILGTGGAARAVLIAVAMSLNPMRVNVVSRSFEKANDVCQKLGCGFPATHAELLDLLPAASLIVNTTPVGMNPHPDRSPIPESYTFQPHQTVYDLIYAPGETKLLHHARSNGAAIIGGLPMLVGQAAASFKIWTGKDMPIQVVEDALRVRLQQD